MSSAEWTALLAVAVLAAAHLAPPMLAFVELTPRSWALSAAGGVSVAYVFVHLLPEVAEAQQAVNETATGLVAEFERHAYVAALVGLGVFYALERAAIRSAEKREAEGEDVERHPTSGATFWVSVAAFALYNAIIGHLAVQRAEHDDVPTLALFTVALALHFVVNDLGLRERHKHPYDRFGRPILVAAVLAGWAVGVATDLAEAAVGLVLALLAGAIVLNVLKEELPRERQSRIVPLVAGAAGYAALVLAA